MCRILVMYLIKVQLHLLNFYQTIYLQKESPQTLEISMLDDDTFQIPHWFTDT